jgi:multisubunit Na+/H+ antiporter MnhB subunit
MGEQDDVMDQKGRLKRGIIALAVGIACAVGAYGVLYGMARPDSYSDTYYAGAATTNAGSGGPWKFVWYFTGVAFVGGASITLAILQTIAKRRWQRERFPEARKV